MMKKLSINVLAFLFMLGTFSVFNLEKIGATSAIGDLPCPAYSLEKVTSPTSYTKVGCYSTFTEANNAMNNNPDKDLVIRHDTSKSPMKIVAMKRGVVANVPDRAGDTNSQSTTNLYRTVALASNTTQRTYVNVYNTMAYFGTYSNGNAFNIGIAGFNGYIKASSADLIPMIYIEKNWPIALAGDGNGNNVIRNTIKPSYYTVTAGTPNELSFFYTEINRSNPTSTNEYVYFGSSSGEPWFKKLGQNGSIITYQVNNVKGVRVRTGPGTSYPESKSSPLGLTEIFYGNDARPGEWIKLENYQSSHSYSVRSYGAAPDWLPVGTYYSWDGIRFYTDLEMTKEFAPGNEYYNYFQFLPARSYTTHTAEQLNKYLIDLGYNSRSKSAMYDSGIYFINGQHDYFMNALMVYSLAIHESAYGTSNYALNRNNLFGWNAYDSDPGQASYFKSIEQAISEHMSRNLNGYLQLADWRYAGNGLGQKESGFNKQYASDPYWGTKISRYMYQFDKVFGSTDLYNYRLGKFPDNSVVNVRKEPSLSSDILYQTKSGLFNTTAIILNETNGWYEIYLQNITNGTDKGYVSMDLLQVLNSPKNNPIPKPPTPPPVSNLDVIKVLGASASGDILYGFNLQNPISGIISKIMAADSKAVVTVTDPSGKVKPSNSYIATGDTLKVVDGSGKTHTYLTAVKGDVNGDGKINASDYVSTANHILGKKVVTGAQFVALDVNSDGKITASDYVGIANHILGRKLIH